MFPLSGAMLALTGALAAACFVKAFGITFLAQPRSDHARHAHEASFTMLLGQGILTVTCVFLGLFPTIFLKLFDPLTSQFTGQELSANLSAANGLVLAAGAGGGGTVSTLGLTLVGLSLLAIPFVLWVILATRAQTRRGPTWDCGLRGLTPQMEYTATGFSKPIRMIFKALFRPRREVQREYDFSPYFATTVRFESHVEEVLQNRCGPRIWQPYSDLIKFFRKDMVISENASWVFSFAPYVVLLSALLAGLLVPMATAQAPLSLFGGVLALVGLLALGRFFLALGGLDPGSAFGGMGSSREMTIAAIAEPAMMLAIFTVAITAGSTDLSQIVQTTQGPIWKLLNPRHVMAFAALFIVLLAETGRIPVDNPATHLELTMVHEAMILEYSGRYLALMEWGASVKQLVLMTLLANIFFPIGLAADSSLAGLGLGLLAYVAKLLALAGAVILVETTNAKL